MMIHQTSLRCALTAATLGLGLVACGGGSDNGSFLPAPVATTPTTPGTPSTPPPASPVSVGDTVALTNSGKLISFNRTNPEALVGSIDVSGLASNELLLGIDYRPADSTLYGLGNAGNVYTLDPATGVASLKSKLRPVAGDDNPFTALSGSSFAVDFNPVADRLRIVSNGGQNLRVNVDTGDALTDGAITPADASITAGAYTNSFAGTTSTQLYDIDATAGLLRLQDPPNNGTLVAGIPLGLTADSTNGFDIDARTNKGYAALTVGGETALYTINVSATANANAATKVGVIGGGAVVRGIALAATAAPRALALTGTNQLVAFDPRKPNTITATTAITGLGGGEILVGMDFRPKDGLLYALSDSARLYIIDPDTGAAVFRAALVADPADATLPYAGLSGTRFSVDFNPVADRLRVIGDGGQNLRIAVETVTTAGVTVNAGNTTTDGPLNRSSGVASVLASAYTNSFAGSTSTMLYNLEQNTDQLTLQNPPNDGVLVDVGALGVDISASAGFDIGGGANGLILGALRVGGAGPFSLYTVALATGAATLYQNTSGNAALSQIGGAGGPTDLIDLAIRF